jgi:hypothetical protein
MATLILDLKTVGESWDGLPQPLQTYLLRWVERTARNQTERQLGQDETINRLSLSPFTGHVISLGIFDRERAEGVVYVIDGEVMGMASAKNISYKVRSEAVLLAEFWDGVCQYDTVVTWNGRSHIIPFLLHRSVAARVMPTVDLLRKRYLAQQTPPYHVDLLDELSWYGACSNRPSLPMVCRTYGIPTDGIVGQDEVSGLVATRNWEAVAHQSTRDLLATVAVYEKWLQYLAPRDSIQKIDCL